MEQAEKQHIRYRETRIQITTGLSSETTNHRKKMEQNLKRLKENKLSQEFSVSKTCIYSKESILQERTDGTGTLEQRTLASISLYILPLF